MTHAAALVRVFVGSLVVAGVLFGGATQSHAADPSLKLLPESFTLTGPEGRQSLVVETYLGANATGQVVDAKLQSSNAAVVKIENGVAIPVANGTALITATTAAGSATAEVTVAAMDQPFAWSFRNHVESVLSKTGCNSARVTEPWPARRVSSCRSARLTPWPTTSSSPARPGPAAWS